jgi:hypothetical protein
MQGLQSARLTVVLAAVILHSGSASGAVKVGEATLIQTTVTGSSGPMIAKSSVHRDERIRTSNSGLGEFQFRDGTKFAVGRNSAVVIDKFVFDDSRSAQNLTIGVAKGSFRWISGASKSSAYTIKTPAGTIGIRGTALDFHVGQDGVTSVVLLSGAARFCGANGCQELKRRCDVIVATPQGGVSAPKRLDQASLRIPQNARVLPFLTGDQQLSRKFRVRRLGCQLQAALGRTPASTVPQTGITTGRVPAGSSTPASPSTPGTPSAPSDSNGPGRGDNGRGNGGNDGSPNGRGDDGR